MGAMVYIPVLGRFLQVDPVEGGGDNAYAYVNDPVNEEDLDGQIAPLIAFAAWQLGRIAVQQVVKYAVKQAATQAARQVTKKVAVHSTKKIAQKVTVKKIAPTPRSVAGKAMQQINRDKEWIRNGNNVLRIGRPAQNQPFRISIGPANARHQAKSRIPFNIHIEKAKAGLNTRKGKCVKFWGNWRC